jgi:hypothetical protein
VESYRVHSTDWSIVACPGWLWWWRIWWNEDWQGKPKYSEKTCPSATLSTTNPTWRDPGSNTGHRGGKPATNRLSYGPAVKLNINSALLILMEGDWLSTNRDIPFCSQDVHYHIHKSLLTNPILRQMSPIFKLISVIIYSHICILVLQAVSCLQILLLRFIIWFSSPVRAMCYFHLTSFFFWWT